MLVNTPLNLAGAISLIFEGIITDANPPITKDILNSTEASTMPEP